MDTLIIGLVLFVILLRILLRTWLKGFGQAPLRQSVTRPTTMRELLLVHFYQNLRWNLGATAVLYIYITWAVRHLEPTLESPVYLNLADKDEALAMLTSNIGLWPMLAMGIIHTLFPPPQIRNFGIIHTPDGLTQLRWLYVGYVYGATWLVVLRLGYSTNDFVSTACVLAGAFLLGKHFQLAMHNTRVLKELTR